LFQLESEALQSENNALINAYSSQSKGALYNPSSGVLDDTPVRLITLEFPKCFCRGFFLTISIVYQMEDTNAASLAELADQAGLEKQLDGAEVKIPSYILCWADMFSINIIT